MNAIMKINPNLRLGIVVSTLVHLLLLLLFLLTEITIAPAPLPVAEVSFISGRPGLERRDRTVDDETHRPSSGGAASAIAKEPPSATVKPTPAPPTKPASSSPVTPPKRRMIEEEDPTLTSRSADKIEAEDPTPTSASADAGRTDDAATPATTPQGIATAPAENRETASESADGSSGDSGQPFTIEGEAAQRVIVGQIIPVYPEGLQREAVIKFRFAVQPDGRITDIIPMRKGDAVLERITIEALSQWRFNPLPSNAEQKIVRGMITFRYELR